MKTALVLSGGGAKGAYHVGCIKALIELNIHIDIVCGTSIGALNGLLIVQQDYKALEDLWKQMTLHNVMNTLPNMTDENLISKSNLIFNFFKKYVNEKGADITPLKEKVYSLFDIEKYTNSPIQYGLVSVKYPSLEPMELTQDDFPPEMAVHYALASGSCFPIFPVYYIENQGYIDGGYYDNLPISLALKMGAKQVIAIELHNEMIHPHFKNRPNIKAIIPSHDLGNFLDFDRKVLDQRIKLGYLDVMKAYDKLYGYRYAFYKDDSINSTEFYHFILRIEESLSHTKKNKLLHQNCPLTTYLSKHCTKQVLAMQDYIILALEVVLKYYDYPYDIIYDFKEISHKLYKQFISTYTKSEKNKELSTSGFSLSYWQDKIKQISSKERINYFYKQICMKQDEITTLLQFFEQEFIIALFMYCCKKEKQ